MTNNDILRRLRYLQNYNDDQLIEVFSAGGVEAGSEDVCNWLKKDDDPDYQCCPDRELAAFLNGFIIQKRGARDGKKPVPESELNNNIILRKLMIAFSLKSDQVLELMAKVDFSLGKSELSAFFRKPEHKNYRKCKDQILRNFLNALQASR